MSAALLIVCTGNVARSVMARCMLEWLSEAEGTPLRLATAGTHALEGQPAGFRTQAALAAIPALEGVSVARHRSHQLTEDDLTAAELVVVMESNHVAYVRRHHPGAAGRTATLRHLCRVLTPRPPELAARVAALELATAELDPGDDVLDPAGGDDAAYATCARDLWALTTALVGLI